MKEHVWETEYVDGGQVDGHFWICRACGASGGPAWPGKSPPLFEPFLANGSGLKVGHDCDRAKQRIETLDLENSK